MPKASVMKYDNFAKAVPFQDFSENGFRRGAVLDKKWLGFDVHVKYGTYWLAGRMARNPTPPMYTTSTRCSFSPVRT